MKDYSEYLKKPGMMDFIEKSWLTDCKEIHDSYGKVVNDTIKKFKLKSVIEIGCGTGEVAKRLIGFKVYDGIDQNENCVKLATEKNDLSKIEFNRADIRKAELAKRDLVCSFGVLKHFGLHEWNEIFKKVCSLGDYLIFNMPISDKTHDDGKEFHHVWMEKKELEAEIIKNGFVIIQTTYYNMIEPIFICKRIEK